MFTEEEINKIFDLLTDYSEERKKELIKKYNEYPDNLKIDWIKLCINTKMCNTSKVLKNY